jgi:DNA polymerase III epsilon subunit-like protein
VLEALKSKSGPEREGAIQAIMIMGSKVKEAVPLLAESLHDPETNVRQGAANALARCFVDVETTGAVFGFHELIDIAAIRTSPDASQVKSTWSSRIRPRYPERIEKAAQELNGFRAEEWATAREPSAELWTEFVNVVRGCVPICHNPSFDRALVTLAAAAEQIVDLELDYHWIGTESLAWPLYLRGELPKMSLPALCDFFGIRIEPSPHTALGGATVCHKVYCALMRHLSSFSDAAGSSRSAES